MYMHKDALAELQPIDVLNRWDASIHRHIALAFDHSKEIQVICIYVHFSGLCTVSVKNNQYCDFCKHSAL